MKVRAAIAVVVVGAVLAGACGGGGRPTHHDFTETVGRRCRRANHDLGAVELHRLTGPDAAASIDEVVTLGRQALDDLRATKPPKADEARVEEWLAALEQVLDEGDYASSLLRGGDRQAAFRAATRASILAARARVLGRSLGVPHACRFPSLVAPSLVAPG